MEINHTEAAIKMLLEYIIIVTKINEVLNKKELAVKEQRFSDATELRILELQLKGELPSSETLSRLASHFKSAEAQRATF